MGNNSKLRARAECELNRRTKKETLAQDRDLNEVIQELRIHQVELEMQNDELQKTQATLESSRDRYKQLYEFAPVGIFTCNPEGNIIAANATLGKLLDVPSSDLLGASFARFSTQSCRDTYYHHARAVLASGGEKSCTIQLIRNNGKVLLTDMKSNIEEVAGKKCIRTSLLDITDRSHAEAHLHLTSCAIEKASEGIFMTDKKGGIISVNTAFKTITGYETHEIIGQNPKILHSGKQDAAFYENMWRQLHETDQWQGEIWNRKKNGDIYPENLSISVIRNIENEVINYIGIFSDISENLSLEEQLRQAQKMEAIGTLVGGIAHDFNNMLAGITGNLHLAKRLAQNSPELLEKLANIHQLSMRAATMISQMLTFARKGMVQMQDLSFSSIVKETIKMSRVSVPENIIFHSLIANEELIIHGDVTQLQQVIMNLVNNAHDAVGTAKEPEISLSLSAFTADETFRRLHPELLTDHLVRLTVRDNGCGISDKHLETIFDPFFTTKEVGMGTGLGLSMCYGAIKGHHGIIDVESTIGKGSAFHVYLPLPKEASVAEDRTAEHEEAWQGKGETILIADDEPCVRESVAEVLEDRGYRVLQAPDGKKALELFDVHHGEIQLAILDIVMPYVGGLQLAEQFRLIRPDLPILFATGYDKSHVLDQSLPISNSEILTKPFHFDKLGRMICKLII